MKTPFRNSAYRQRGAVLVVSLIMLAVMTLFVISMLKTSVIELKIGGASHVAALNFANAEVAIDTFISANTLPTPRFGPKFTTVLCAPPCLSVINTAPVGSPAAVQGGTVTVDPQEIYCGPLVIVGTQMGALSLTAVQFDVRAAATGTLGGTVALHQGLQTVAPPSAAGC